MTNEKGVTLDAARKEIHKNMKKIEKYTE
jgi:hypothetical protein